MFRHEEAANESCWAYQHIKTNQTMIMSEHKHLRDIMVQGGNGSLSSLSCFFSVLSLWVCFGGGVHTCEGNQAASIAATLLLYAQLHFGEGIGQSPLTTRVT